VRRRTGSRKFIRDIASWRELTGGNAGIGLWRSGVGRIKKILPMRSEPNLRLGKGGFLDDVVASVRQRLAKTKFSRSGVDQMLAYAQEAEIADPDKASYLSLLLVEIYSDRTTITPVLMKELESLYDATVTYVAIQNTNPLPDPALVDACKRLPAIVL